MGRLLQSQRAWPLRHGGCIILRIQEFIFRARFVKSFYIESKYWWRHDTFTRQCALSLSLSLSVSLPLSLSLSLSLCLSLPRSISFCPSFFLAFLVQFFSYSNSRIRLEVHARNSTDHNFWVWAALTLKGLESLTQGWEPLVSRFIPCT